jgi:hypothetical protein
MMTRDWKKRVRSVQPALAELEGRELLSTVVVPHHMGEMRMAADVGAAKHHAHVRAVKHHGAAADVKLESVPRAPLAGATTITPINRVAAGGYQFLNFDGPSASITAGFGTNMNGISNSGEVVGVSLQSDGAFVNFTTNPNISRNAQTLNINGSTTAMAFGVNSIGIVVGTDGNGNAFYDKFGTIVTFIPSGGTSAAAFGINDTGTIVGQYTTTDGTTPGFLRTSTDSIVTINAPSGPDVVNAQGVNNHGLVVGFYVGNDGHDHGFIVNTFGLHSGTLTGIPVADPVIPSVPGEPGATFVFSQILAVNDEGIAVGYYGDSTGSQHGFIYNTNTGRYTFLDDPSEGFFNGMEVTQITGINNSGEITGFYTDANGVAHGFTAKPIIPPPLG